MGKRTALLFCVIAACGAPPSYLTSAGARRASLEASLVNPHNDYSALRLREYGKAWDALPEANPEVTALGVNEPAAALTITDAARRGDPEALRALGEQAFFRYPAQRMPALRVAFGSPASYGLWSDAKHGTGGLVRVGADLAVTCATCHARGGNPLVVGAANDALLIGQMYVDAGATDTPELHLAWGPGRLDVTTTRGDEPMRIADLRPVKFAHDLHQDATLTLHDVTTLAIRIETLIIVSNGESLRPPREVALGLAMYLWSLGDALPMHAPSTDGERRGEALFDSRCRGCHVPPSFSGPPVPLEEVGTDPTVGRSRDRGTGTYRVPSLRGVSTRGALLHDASAPSLDAMFDPSRAVRGHRYGRDLDEAARRDLIAYLTTL